MLITPFVSYVAGWGRARDLLSLLSIKDDSGMTICDAWKNIQKEAQKNGQPQSDFQIKAFGQLIEKLEKIRKIAEDHARENPLFKTLGEQKKIDTAFKFSE